MPLHRELATYAEKQDELEGHQGKFVLIHGDSIVEIFDTYADAIGHGYRLYSVREAFLVKRVEIPETAQTITRLVAC
jgi:hypothetical protein